jgi:hypothetical protein
VLWPGAFCGYAALTAAFAWPLPIHLASAFPHDALDPAFITWILSWNARALPLTAHWWDAPMFWPAGGTIGLSEHLVGISVLTTPMQWLGASPLTAHNLAFLLSFPLSALAAHALVVAIVRRHDAGVLAGLIFGFSPYRTSQLSHMQVLWAFGMPLALFALHKHTERPDRAWLGVFGAAWLLQALANGYYLMFFPVLLACWVLWFAAGHSRAQTLWIAGTWTIASVPLIPFLLGYHRIQGALNLERRFGEIDAMSADLTALFAAPPALMLWHRLSEGSRPEAELFPGALALILVFCGVLVAAWRRQGAAVGAAPLRIARLILAVIAVAIVAIAISPLVVGPWKIALGNRVILSVGSPDKPLSIALLVIAVAVAIGPTAVDLWRRRSAFAFYALAALLMFVLSFGPRPKLAGTRVLFRAPYEWLMALPGFSGLRVPARFGMLFVLCLSIAAALAFARLTSSFGRRARIALAAVAAIIVIVESWAPITLAAVPAPIAALQHETGPIIELPLGDMEHDSAALYRSIGHRRPIVNGYSGYVPPHYEILKIALAMGDAGVLDELARDAGLTIAIERGGEFARLSELVTIHPRYQVTAADATRLVYRIPAAPNPLPAAAGERLPVASIAPNFQLADAGRLVDGDPLTMWNSGRPQAGDEQLTIDLGRERDVTLVRVELGSYLYGFPRRLAVDCADEAAIWTACWEGSAAALTLRGVLDNPRNPALTIRVDRAGVRRIRLSQIAVDHDKAWSVAELAVFGR